MFFFGRKSTVNVPKRVYDQIIGHAKEAYPHECCGVLVGNSMGDRKIFESHRANNINTERANDRYVIDPKEINIIDKVARSEGLDIMGFYHSHPDHPDRPSQFDRDMGQPQYSYIIVSVHKGTETSVKSWMFTEDKEPFKEEAIKITAEG
ncbi:MAG: M67 family metallopeptidase [Deltaproteobacteria bacterium]|nr:M67 family metallopeptidase [Deltaproteobacteria bacterium]